MLARKSVSLRFASPPSIKPLIEYFRLMCNDAIRIGLAADASSLKRLSKLTYGELKREVEYKAAWEGVPVVTLSSKETKGHHHGLPAMRGETPRQSATINDTIANYVPKL